MGGLSPGRVCICLHPLLLSKFRHILAINSAAPCRYVSEELSRVASFHAMDLTLQDQTLPIGPYHIRYENNETGGKRWILYLSQTVVYLLTSDMLYSIIFPDGRQRKR